MGGHVRTWIFLPRYLVGIGARVTAKDDIGESSVMKAAKEVRKHGPPFSSTHSTYNVA